MGTVNIKYFLFASVITLFSAHVYAKKPLSSVADLRYGVALFHYYEGNYMAALTELLVAEKRGGIQGHGDNPEIMEGGFSLAFGMERHASDIFERLLEENRPRKVRDAAWFYLSKLRYLREDYPAAEQALTKISNRPDISIRDELRAHKINLAIKQDDLVRVEELIRRERPRAGWMPYVYFNLGSAYARKQEYEKAVVFFAELEKPEFLQEEHRALYDKSMTAAGYCYIFIGQYEQAIEYFNKVRLTSTLSNPALIGYGWAAAKMENYELALKPWSYLSNRSLSDENIMEALVAVPFAYEEIGAEGKALQKFRLAEDTFETEIAKLDDVIFSMEGDSLLDALQISESRSIDWLNFARDNELTPQLLYLAELFSREQFQKFVQELRDLLALQKNLHTWKEKLVFYTENIEGRQTFRNNKSEILAAGEITDQIAQMRRLRSEQAQKIERIAATKDYFALANEDEADLITRAKRVLKNVDIVGDEDPFIDEYREQGRWYYGILMWNSADVFSDRMWRAVKTLNGLDTTIKDLRVNHDRFQYLLQNAPDLDPYKVEIAEAQLILDVEITNADAIVEKSKDNLRFEVVNVLEHQRTRLKDYLSQSRLSIARLYDKARERNENPPEETEVQLTDKEKKKLAKQKRKEQKRLEKEKKKEAKRLAKEKSKQEKQKQKEQANQSENDEGGDQQ